MKTQTWRDIIFWMAYAACMVIMIESIVNTRQSMRVAEIGFGTISPQNLRTSIGLFRSSIAAELPAFPVEQLVSSKSYKAHEAILAAYTVRLELLEHQNRDRGLWLSRLSLAAVVGLVITSLLRNKKRIEPNQALEPTSTAVTPPAVAGDRASGTRGSP